MQMDIEDRELLFQQKYIYQAQTVNTLTGLNTFLLFAYYICIIIVLYYLFTKYELNMYVKVGFSLLLIAYPFVIYYIEMVLYNVGHYAGSMITGTAADRND
jgi:hypothetical protein